MRTLQMKLTRSSLALLCALASPTLFAFNSHWLNESPLRYFTDEDWELAKQAVQKALRDDPQTASEQAWDNPESGHSGSAHAGPAATENGRSCRQLRISNQAGGLSGSTTQSWCRQADDSWKPQAPAR
jgi:surface antigen